MRIVFGWYSFKIKTYRPEDLGIVNKDAGEYAFEVRQRVFQLFYIPVFPLGKIYAMRMGKELYHVTDEIKSNIRQRKDYRTPWYSFALPILAFVVLFFSAIGSVYSGYKRDSNSREFYAQHLAYLDRELNTLTPYHYIGLLPHDNHYANPYFLKVLSVKGDEVKVLKSPEPVSDPNQVPYELVKYFNEKAGIDTITVSLALLKKALCRDYDTYNHETPFGEVLLDDSKKYMVNKVWYINGPVLESDGGSMSTSADGTSISLGFKNVGTKAELVQVKNMVNTIKWTNVLPMPVKGADTNYDNKFGLETSDYDGDEYQFMLVFEDSLFKEHKFMVKGQQLTHTIERIR